MRRHAWIAIACGAALACSKSEEKKVSGEPPSVVSACETPAFADLIQQHPIHVLLGAADVLPGNRAISDSTLQDWRTFEPRHLVDRVDPSLVHNSIARLCTIIDALPAGEQSTVVAGIRSWIDTSFAIDQAEVDSPGIEYFASAVVRVPEVRPAIPESVVARLHLVPDQMAGYTMASGEFTMMNYELAHILSRMPTDERDRILEEVRAKATELLRREEQ